MYGDISEEVVRMTERMDEFCVLVRKSVWKGSFRRSKTRKNYNITVRLKMIGFEDFG